MPRFVQCASLDEVRQQIDRVDRELVALIAERGLGTDYHFNQIVGWKVAGDGAVTFHGET